ncbi:MAG TPA: glycosyltransferase family 2 protein [Patescibacteria group bacterium]|nr:glycosyltransferase family 2 protein [Patescibacteria group bacterium]
MFKSLPSRIQNEPFVSVVMPVYNADLYLKESIDSILAQTYRHFEFIIVDDGSTDHSLDIIKKYVKKDRRIKLFQNTYNQGVSKTIKKGIDHAKGSVIARMDADDRALPDRFEKQIDYLGLHPHTIVIGGQCQVIDHENNIIGYKRFPIDFKSIYQSIMTFLPLQEPTLMIARDRLPQHFSFYGKNYTITEEIELIFKLFKYGKVENLPDVVLLYRIHDHNSSLKNVRKTFYYTLIGRIKGIFLYGYTPSIKDILVNIIQLIIITIIPQKLSLWLYYKTRKILKNKKNMSQKFSYA